MKSNIKKLKMPKAFRILRVFNLLELLAYLLTIVTFHKYTVQFNPR